MNRSLITTAWMLLGLNCVSVCLSAQAVEDVELLEEQAIKAAIATVEPSVARIETTAIGQGAASGPTTGLVVAEDGYVVASAFAFSDDPAAIFVTISGTRYDATMVARDHSRNLVLLRVDAEEKLVVPVAVKRSDMKVGQRAIAVGRTLDEDRPNISVGIVSATNRIWGKAIQTDAKISPNNYGGPLVDLNGKVFGVLVPLSLQSTGAAAGAEWYDSGIGFAVPLTDINERLAAWKEGDLHPGIMGITLKGDNIYVDTATVAACQLRSPAARAGLKVGDTIVGIDGQTVERQSQLRHLLGPHYAGDTITVAVMRNTERLEIKLELAAKLEPYEHPFLGVLPMRGLPDDPAGVTVRYVYPDSPAAQAGMQAGDRITKIDAEQSDTVQAMQQAIANLEPGVQTDITYVRDHASHTAAATLISLPTAIPDELPAAHAEVEMPEGERPAVGEIDFRLAEESNQCMAYVPDSYNPELSYGVVLWLHAPGKYDQKALLERWRKHCDNHDLILLAPQAAQDDKWGLTEVGVIRKLLDRLTATYNIDPQRIVVHGYQGGGAMAYLVSFAFRDLVRGVAVIGANLPERVPVPANNPLKRLAVFIGAADNFKSSREILSGVKILRARNYPVTIKNLGETARYLNDDEIAELVRWIDTLDRI